MPTRDPAPRKHQGLITPSEMADRLGISPSTLRAWLRETYPRAPHEWKTRWYLTSAQTSAATHRFG